MSGILQALFASFPSGNAYVLYGWGNNSSGQIGDGTINSRSSPVQVGVAKNWYQVSGGSSAHSAAIKTDGTLWTWGANGSGQLGIGNTTGQSSPTQVGALTNWAQVSAGSSNCAAVKTDGTAWAWGRNQYGELGDGTTQNKSSPIQVGALTDWAQISAGNFITAAVKTDGTIWAWGDGGAGGLGQNNTIDRSSPVQVGALTNWAQAHAGSLRILAVKTDGTLWGWGLNRYGAYSAGGAIGDGTYINRSSPVQVGALTNWAQVETNSDSPSTMFSGAVKTDGTLWTWGQNRFGQLGIGIAGFNQQELSPVQVGSLTNWLQFSVGNTSSGAVKTDGTLWMWGTDNQGRLGTGTNYVSRSSPVQIGSLTGWRSVALGATFAHAILEE